MEMQSEQLQRKKDNKKGGGDYYRTKLSYLGKQYASEVFQQYFSGRIDNYKAGELLNSKVDYLPKLPPNCRLIDANKLLEIESEAYIEAQTKLLEEGKKELYETNKLVHLKIQKLIYDTETVIEIKEE